MIINSFCNDLSIYCKENPEQTAIIDQKTGYECSYGHLWDLVLRFSSLMTASGVCPGDRVFSTLPDSFEQMIVFLSSLWLGLEFCPLSINLSADELVRSLSLYRPDVGIIPSDVDDVEYASLKRYTNKQILIPIPLRSGIESWLPVTQRGIPSSIGSAGRLLLFTSGTTSEPKAIVLNGDKLWSSARAWSSYHDILDADSRFYNFLPMSYLGGLFNLGLIPLACHGSFVISGGVTGSSFLRIWPEINDNRVDTLWFPPTILRGLLTIYKERRGDKNKLINPRVCFLGMSPATILEKEQFEEVFNIPVLENFALSETTFLTSERLGASNQRQQGSVGTVLPWVELRLEPLDEDMAKTEIQVRTPFLFEGYLDPGGEVILPITSDGFFKTGDLGVLSDNLLVLKGRSKEIIKKAGFLVGLQEIEEIAYQNQAILMAVAVGIPHEFYGESSILCVQVNCSEGFYQEILDTLVELITTKMARFKWPDRIVVVDNFPTTESGKVQKWVVSGWLDSNEWVKASVILR